MRQDIVLKKPVMTEKSLSLASVGKYTFVVHAQATKKEIAKVIGVAFGVHVTSVHTINLKGKKRRLGKGRKEVIGASRTKAIVTLAPSEKIDLFAVGGKEEVK